MLTTLIVTVLRGPCARADFSQAPLRTWTRYGPPRRVVSQETRSSRSVLAWLAAAALAVVLLRRDRLARAEEADVAVRAAMASAAVLAASVLATAYVLPWYDAPLWAVLALLPGSRLDRIALAHTSLLTVAYLPGNALDLASPVLRGVLLVVRRIVAPPLLLALLVAATRRGRAATPLRSPV